MKRLFHVSMHNQNYDASAITRAFSGLGLEVTQFNWQIERFNYGTEVMRKRCVSLAEDVKPDLIFVHCQNPDAFDVKTMQLLQEIAFTINYTFDVREDISWYKKIAPNIGMTIFACEEDVHSCEMSGIKNVAYLPSSCDFEAFMPRNPAGRLNVPEIVFIGNNYVGTNLNYPLASQRQEMVEFMYDTFGKRFLAYGHSQKGGLITDKSHEVEIYNSCKIAVTHNNFLRKGYCSDRDWRAVGCGAFTVHQYFDGVMDLFGHAAVVYSSLEDLKFICEYFLDERNDEERNNLAAFERSRVVMNHSWTRRVHEIKKLVQQNLAKKLTA